MAYIIGRIYPNEGFSCVKEGNVAWNKFRVNTSQKSIPVYNTKHFYTDYTIKFQNSKGVYSTGYIKNGAYSFDLVRNYTKSLDAVGVRDHYDSHVGSVVSVRHLTSVYAINGQTLLGQIPGGSLIAFDTGACGITYPHKMRVSYYQTPTMKLTGEWNKCDRNSNYGWIDTQCRTKGYKYNWDIDHRYN